MRSERLDVWVTGPVPRQEKFHEYHEDLGARRIDRVVARRWHRDGEDGGVGQSYWADQWLKTHQSTAPNVNHSTGTVRSFWYRGASTPVNEGPGLAGGGG